MTTDLQDGIEFLRGDLGSLEALSERSSGVIAMQRLEESPLLALIAQ